MLHGGFPLNLWAITFSVYRTSRRCRESEKKDTNKTQGNGLSIAVSAVHNHFKNNNEIELFWSWKSNAALLLYCLDMVRRYRLQYWHFVLFFVSGIIQKIFLIYSHYI